MLGQPEARCGTHGTHVIMIGLPDKGGALETPLLEHLSSYSIFDHINVKLSDNLILIVCLKTNYQMGWIFICWRSWNNLHTYLRNLWIKSLNYHLFIYGVIESILNKEYIWI